ARRPIFRPRHHPANYLGWLESRANERCRPRPDGAFTLEEVPGVAVMVALAGGEKCARCWQVLADVGAQPAHADICSRCAEAVDAHPADPE
ncbi:MAG: hypothetical protein HN527_14995, partial [Rhodospirillaceae bacterium]|nr:hypothetical protein [Rhodospirillaceae bacterium]